MLNKEIQPDNKLKSQSCLLKVIKTTWFNFIPFYYTKSSFKSKKN